MRCLLVYCIRSLSGLIYEARHKMMKAIMTLTLGYDCMLDMTHTIANVAAAYKVGIIMFLDISFFYLQTTPVYEFLY